MMINRQTNQIGFDPQPRLRVTKPVEQTLALLLALYGLKQAESATAVVDYVQTHEFWHGVPPDWAAAWQDRCVQPQHATANNGAYSLTACGMARLHDLCTLAFALRDPFRHLTTSGYRAACHARQGMKGRRPFTKRPVSQVQYQERRGEYHVYVILLQADVVNGRRHLVRNNPKRRTNHPCLYVGYTAHTPEIRFRAHMYGEQACQMVTEHGVCLVPDLYAHLNPINGRAQAEATERQHAADLRQQGYTVSAGHHDWQLAR